MHSDRRNDFLSLMDHLDSVLCIVERFSDGKKTEAMPDEFLVDMARMCKWIAGTADAIRLKRALGIEEEDEQ